MKEVGEMMRGEIREGQVGKERRGAKLGENVKKIMGRLVRRN